MKNLVAAGLMALATTLGGCTSETGKPKEKPEPENSENSPQKEKSPPAFLFFESAEISADNETNDYQRQKLKDNNLEEYNWYSIQVSRKGASQIEKITPPGKVEGKSNSYKLKQPAAGRGSDRYFVGVISDSIRQGQVNFVSIPLDSLLLNISYPFKWNGNEYWFLLKGQHDETRENEVNGVVSTNALRNFALLFGDNNVMQRLEEDTMFVVGSDYLSKGFLWIGDLDGDQFPDVISPLCYDKDHPVTSLFLSHGADKHELVRKVTHLK